MDAISQIALSKALCCMHKDIRISNNISPTFIVNGPINKIPALVKIMAWRRPGDKPLFESMMVVFFWHMYASLGLNGLSYDIDIVVK